MRERYRRNALQWGSKMGRKFVSTVLFGLILYGCLAVCHVLADRDYFNARWKTLKYRSADAKRPYPGTSYASRCFCRTKGTLVLNKREINNIYIRDGEETTIIGPAGVAGSTSTMGALVDMRFYTSVVVINGDDYTIYGEPREVERVAPWGMWVVR